MNILAPLLVGGFLSFPGATIAFLTRSGRSTARVICDAFLWSIAIDTAIYSLPMLRATPLTAWFYICTVLSVVGMAFCITFLLVRLRSHRREFVDTIAHCAADPYLLGAAVILLVYATITATRPIIDWDALNYYLYSAMSYITAGHVGLYFSPAVTPIKMAPNTIPPILPLLYSFAYYCAAGAHISPDAVVRWIPFVFLCVSALAVYRLSRCVLPEMWAKLAVIIFLVMPVIIDYMTATPLYVDMATVCLTTLLIVEVLERPKSLADGLRIGVIITLLTLTKVTGLPIVIMCGLAVAVARIGGKLGRVLILLAAVVLVIVAFAGGPLRSTGTPSQWLAIAIVTFALLAVVPHRGSRNVRVRWRVLLGAVLCSLPALYFVIEQTMLVGSPAGYYLESALKIHLPNWSWALQSIKASNIYSSAAQPGLPENFALGIALWWGFAPGWNAFALYGCVRGAMRSRVQSLVASFVGLYLLGWLTVFNLTDFRHLMPIVPLLASSGLLGLRYVANRNRRVIFGAIVAIAICSIPFIWSAEQRLYDIPLRALERWRFDQWEAVSTFAYVNIAATLVLELVVVSYLRNNTSFLRFPWVVLVRRGIAYCAVWWLASQLSPLSAIILGTCALLTVGYLDSFLTQCDVSSYRSGAVLIPVTGGAALVTTGFSMWTLFAMASTAIVIAILRILAIRRLVPGCRLAPLLGFSSSRTQTVLVSGFLLCAAFAPIIWTGVTPGFKNKAHTVWMQEAYGYFPALEELRWWLARRQGPHRGALLTMFQDGVSWKTKGRYRALELSDAYNVADMREITTQQQLWHYLVKHDVVGGIVPAAANEQYKPYERLLTRTGVPVDKLLENRALVRSRIAGTWQIFLLQSR